MTMNTAMKTKAAEMIGKRMDLDVSQKSISLDKDSHTATFVMSTSSVDRHGDIVDQESWMLEYFRENPALFFNHKSSDFPLGRWISVGLQADPINVGKTMLVGTAQFSVEIHHDVQRAWDHLVAGDLNMVSVGFIPHVVDYDEDTDAFILKSCELMECSLVGIGSNRRALAKSNDVVDALIDTKKQIEDSIVETDPSATRHKNAILLINKAIRQVTK